MNHWRKPAPLQPMEMIPSDYAKLTGAVIAFLLALAFLLLWAAGVVEAETCPNPGQPCKVLVLTPDEEQLLIKQGGILDSAAAGRYIDLGNVAAYFRMKLMQAPAGEVKPVEQPKPPAAEEPKP